MIMKMIRGTSALLLASCGLIFPEPKTPATVGEVEAAVKKDIDPYQDASFISGPRIRVAGYPYHPSIYLQVCSSLRHPEVRSDRLCVSIWGDLFYARKAHDVRGCSLEIAGQDFTFGGSPDRETLRVLLPGGYLESNVLSGIDIRLDGQGGSLYLRLPPYHIQGFLRACKSLR